MIKVIAFDLVGVLVKEKDIQLSVEESRLERLFGPNLNDNDYLLQAQKIVKDSLSIPNITYDLINKLYLIKDVDIMKTLKKIYNNIKIIVATNHLSYVRNFIETSFDNTYLNDIVISAEINKIKPNADFYEYILEKFNIKPDELLFLDDNIENIEGAKEHTLPSLTYTTDESAEMAALNQQYASATDTAINEIIMGNRSINEFDTIVSDAEKNYLGRILEIQNAAYQRYLEKLKK